MARYTINMRIDREKHHGCFWADARATDSDWEVWDQGTQFALGVVVAITPWESDAKLIADALNLQESIKTLITPISSVVCTNDSTRK